MFHSAASVALTFKSQVYLNHQTQMIQIYLVNIIISHLSEFPHQLNIFSLFASKQMPKFQC